MLPIFDTPCGLPFPLTNLGLRKGLQDKDFQGLVSTAEVATIQLEFKYLSYLTDDDVYWEKVETVCLHLIAAFQNTDWLGQVMEVIRKARMPAGLASIFMR